MLKLTAQNLEGQAVAFEVWQIVWSYLDDGITYVRVSERGGSVPVVTETIAVLTDTEEGGGHG